ncbi:hypothetical protein PoB_004076400 [Plakobranchus ocellatus]|uniref:Uncharacterized protein n=1 Tax=Plakobranchus ocellatus TaxID=259542 RepID=A0AAV4B6D9_9GAST|nr:hypothetical protein PoB_004076400 [Plakobranchus ocellatus]
MVSLRCVNISSVYEPCETCGNVSLEEEATETVQAMESLHTYSQSSSPTTSMANSPFTQSPTIPYRRAPKRKATSTTASVVDEEILKTLQKPGNNAEGGLGTSFRH